MREQGHAEEHSPPRSSVGAETPRDAGAGAWAAALVAALMACAGGDGEADSGLFVPVAKDARVEADAGEGDGSADAAPRDAAGLDAFAPDAAPLPDRDGDGIPDALDPAPDTTNAVLFEDDFTGPRAMWLFTSSAMAASGGVLSVSQTDGIVREGWLGPQPNWTDTLVRTRLRALRRGRSEDDGAGRVALIARVQQVAPDRYLACGVDTRRDVAFFAEHNGGSTAGRTLDDAPLPGAIGPWHDITISSQANRLRCVVDGQVLELINDLYLSGSAGIRAFDVAFEADYLIVNAL